MNEIHLCGNIFCQKAFPINSDKAKGATIQGHKAPELG